MRAVELRGDVDGQVHIAHGFEAALGIGQGDGEIAAEADEYLGAPVEHRLHGGHGIVAVLGRRIEAEGALDAFQHRLGRLFPDADSAVALDVGVAAQGADARAGLADVAAQEQQVGELLHVGCARDDVG